MKQRGTRRWAAILFAACLIPDHRGGAATVRDDVPDAQYTALAGQAQYAAAGYVDADGHVFGSATLIAPDWVLTVAHAVTVNEVGPGFPASEVSFGQGAAANTTVGPDAVVQVIVDPNYNGDTTQGEDLALLQLATPITNIAPAAIYRDSSGSLIGQTMTFVGYGYTGTGLTGYSTATLGTRRAITNVFDAFGGGMSTGGPPNNNSYNLNFAGANVLLTDFDQPGNPGASSMGDFMPTALEGAPAPGDSGGGAYVTVNGQTYLAAVGNFLGAFDDNPLSISPDGHYGDFNGYTSLAAGDSVHFIDSNLVIASAWSSSHGGSWANLANWTGGQAPEFMQATANFGGAIGAASTITLDGNWTVGSVTFNNVNAYTLAGGNGGTLVLDNGGAAAAVTVLAGNHCITAPVVLNSNAMFAVSGGLNVSGPISGAGGVCVGGMGTVTLSGANSYGGSTNVASGNLIVAAGGAIPGGSALTVGSDGSVGTVELVAGIGTVSMAGVRIDAGSVVDIANNGLAINFGSPTADPTATIVGYLTNGQIISTAAEANRGVFAVGYADGNTDVGTGAGANEVLVQYTLAGDANLDGSVDFPDLVSLAQNFGSTGIDWAGGNFTYNPSGSVGFADLVLLAQNFGDSVGPADENSQVHLSMEWQALQRSTAVPEPVSIGLLAAFNAFIFVRRWPYKCLQCDR